MLLTFLYQPVSVTTVFTVLTPVPLVTVDNSAEHDVIVTPAIFTTVLAEMVGFHGDFDLIFSFFKDAISVNVEETDSDVVCIRIHFWIINLLFSFTSHSRVVLFFIAMQHIHELMTELKVSFYLEEKCTYRNLIL